MARLQRVPAGRVQSLASQLVVAFLTLFCLQLMRIAESHFVVRNFNRSLTVAAPGLTDAEEEQFRARFASMSRRVDYLSLREDLTKLAAERGVTLPE